jgi:hypothetical protein
VRSNQTRHQEQRSGAHRRSLRQRVVRGGGGQHPRRDLQAVPGWINQDHRAVAAARPARDLEFEAMERVEGVVDRSLRTYGLVTAVAGIPTSTASCPMAFSCPGVNSSRCHFMTMGTSNSSRRRFGGSYLMPS